jgi:hypothetical protein
MIISLENAKTLVDFKSWTDERVSMKLKAIEETVRKYTNNNFQNRNIRGICSVDEQSMIYGIVPGLRAGDTIQISESKYNAGLYVVDAVSDTQIFVDRELTPEDGNFLVTKIEYPENVVECVINLLEWSITHGAKVGIKSETLSRHSVTYEDSGTLYDGYPIGILNGLKLYKKARC